MTTMTNPKPVSIAQPILELGIDADGNVFPAPKEKGDKGTLEGTLLGTVFPNIRIARISVPDRLNNFEQAVVESAMTTLEWEGVKYTLIGASSSAKDGRFYAVDAGHADAVAKRFHHWPQAAIVYFSILMTDCKQVLELPYARILVVEDHVLGTNDCRGWIREKLYKRLNLPADRFVQFRLAFDAREPKQGKGAFKAMSDAVADNLQVDLVIPRSSVKPGLMDGARFIPGARVQGNLFIGPVVLGTKSVSKVSEMESSYQLLEHASQESLESEIIPAATETVSKISAAWTQGNYEGLLQFMGKFSGSYPANTESEETSHDEDPAFPTPTAPSDLSRSIEWDPVEAALVADGSGMVVHLPYVAQAINRKVARRTFRILTGGGFTLPSFALADDGVLFEYQGVVYSASDWIPEDAAITSLTCEKSLNIRYPIRMKEDLLPVRHLGNDELAGLLPAALRFPSIPEPVLQYILHRQLRLEGTFILHSKTAAKNGGDFDFDTICAMPCDRFPKFVQSRIDYKVQFEPVTKTKKKARSPWWNLPLVAMNARGNKVGIITDLITSCLAAGRGDLAYRLVEELQNALDALKHDVRVDELVIDAIRSEVPSAVWLQYKQVRTLTDLPMQLTVAGSDIVGNFYNAVRPFFGNVLAEERPVSDFRGLFRGERITEAMYAQCSQMNRMYGSQSALIIKRGEIVKSRLNQAREAYATVRVSGDRALKQQAFHDRCLAQAAHEMDLKLARQDLSALNQTLAQWAVGKQSDRAAWAQAMAQVVTKGKGSGGVLLNTFPQEFCDLLAQNTGGKSVQVRVPKVPAGYLDWDGPFLIAVTPYQLDDETTAESRDFVGEITTEGALSLNDKNYRALLKARSKKNGRTKAQPAHC